MADLRVAVLILAGFFLVYAAHGERAPHSSHHDKQRQRLTELSRATTSFGLNLYRHIASQDPRANVLFSPLSVYTALSMTLLGAERDTKRELQSVLSVGTRPGIHRALHAIRASLPRSPRGNVTLLMANALFYNASTVTLADTFKNALFASYVLHPMTLERTDPEAEVNAWVSRATGGKIPNFLSPGSITPDTIVMLLNALYFQGTWRNIFTEDSTRQSDFTTGSGDVIQVQMMSRDGRYAVKPLGHGLAGRVLELPYGSDGRFSLYVILPDTWRGLSDIERGLTVQVLEDAVTNMPEESRYMLSLPKFSLRSRQSLNSVLRGMGLTRLFSNAQLGRMVSATTAGRLAVSDVTHEAVIEVNERGTRAAAVTGLEIVFTSLPPSFTVDRPFLLVLRDNGARLNLFLGRVNRPEALTGA